MKYNKEHEKSKKEIKRDGLGNFVFVDFLGREIKADPNKFVSDKSISNDLPSLCRTCEKNYRTCENYGIRDDDGRVLPEMTKDEYPVVVYCNYYLENKRGSAR